MAEIIIPEEDLEMGEENVENPDEPIIPEYTPNSNETELREELEELKTTVGTYSRDIESLFDRVGKILNSITISEDCRNLTDIQMVISNEIIRNADGNNIYIFTNNSSVWFTSDKTWDNLKGVNALLSMDGDYLRIYYINNVTFTSSISYNPSTQTYDFSEWTYRELPRFKELKSGEAIGSQNGKILTYDPSNGVGFSPFYDTDFLKNDVIKGVIEVTDIEKSSIKEYLNEKYPGYSYDIVEAPQDHEYIQVNPLSVGSGLENQPIYESGMYIFVNASRFSLIKDEGVNPYRGTYGLCSVVTGRVGSNGTGGIYKQHVYYPNLATYWREREGGTVWQDFSKILIKNQTHEVIWGNTSNMDFFTSTGIYICSYGVDKYGNSNIPVDKEEEFSFILNVSVSNSIIGQMLSITWSNGTQLYTRSYNGRNWTEWESMGLIDLGKVDNNYLGTLVKPGQYKGVIINEDTDEYALYTFLYNIYSLDYQTSNIPGGSYFKLEVIDNNLGEIGDKEYVRTIIQKATITTKSGHIVDVFRLMNGTDKIWSPWVKENTNLLEYKGINKPT